MATSLSSTLSNLRGVHRRFLASSKASVAILFALAIPALLGVAALGVDYARLVRARSSLQAALDAAALAAVRETTTSDAQSVLSSFIQSTPIEDIGEPEVTATVQSFDRMTLRAEAAVDIPMTFAALLGISSKQINVYATAAKATYDELYFALDLSGSLGVAATDSDRAALEALTQPYAAPAYGSRLPQGCAFGCHRREGWEPSGKTVYQMAREAGIKLKEDELRTQFSGLVDLLLDSSDEVVQAGMRKISVIGFSAFASELIAPSDVAGDVKDAFDAFSTSDRYQTTFADVFDDISDLLDTQGDGTELNPTKTLILITDGIESRDAFFSQSAIDVSLCEDIKARGFRLAVVEIKYPKLLFNPLYDDTVLPVETTISPALSQCASPGWYFQAIDNDDVPAKFEELKHRLVARGIRLVN